MVSFLDLNPDERNEKLFSATTFRARHVLVQAYQTCLLRVRQLRELGEVNDVMMLRISTLRDVA